MNMTAMEIKTQDVPDISPLRPVEQVQTTDRQMEAKQAREPLTEKNASESISAKEVEEVLEAFQDLSETIQTKLSFSVDDNNNEIVVKVFDKESNELIRQFPSEEMLALQDKMTDLAGFLFNENV
ncbi:MAG TPA: flagellar biosynthesis protein FlaG [Desulfobacteraceae bacterium]|mgnify:CR=1 FL=1|nr:flagellar biosynthesis protein FlaG [Desulfobacteraceae bacterium]|tara:strand:- start:544 stop:918 length:375 start_codon:yes stop_codon:yes gene_type:complete